MPLKPETLKILCKWAYNDRAKLGKMYKLLKLDSLANFRNIKQVLKEEIERVLAEKKEEKIEFPEEMLLEITNNLFFSNPQKFDEHVKEIFQWGELKCYPTLVFAIRKIKKEVFGENVKYTLKDNYPQKLNR